MFKTNSKYLSSRCKPGSGFSKPPPDSCFRRNDKNGRATKLILGFFILFASFLWPTGTSAQEQAPSLPQGDFSDLRETTESEVLEVLSPLTIKLASGDIVYLTGVHLPDYTVEHAGPFALTALKILKDMFEGQHVTLHQTKDKNLGRTNRMGHALGHLKRRSDQGWAQGTLARLGLAMVKTSQRNPEMAAQLYALERQARSEKLGIWAEDSRILAAKDTPEHIGSFQIVEGKVLSAALKKNRVYLNFGSNWRDDFTVSIAPENKRVFSKAMINPLDWNGKTLRVRGLIEEYNGPYIEIDHPEEVQIISAP